MKIFILDFSNNDTFLHQFKSKNYTIIFEKNDGGKAYKTVAEEMPLMIFVNFNHKPSHCLQTITAIKNRKRTNQIPVYFVAGLEENFEKASKLGTIISINTINELLNQT
jgi:hypothetical protein